jgi:hypothetical protein
MLLGLDFPKNLRFWLQNVPRNEVPKEEKRLEVQIC